MFFPMFGRFPMLFPHLLVLEGIYIPTEKMLMEGNDIRVSLFDGPPPKKKGSDVLFGFPPKPTNPGSRKNKKRHPLTDLGMLVVLGVCVFLCLRLPKMGENIFPRLLPMLQHLPGHGNS